MKFWYGATTCGLKSARVCPVSAWNSMLEVPVP